MHSLVSSYGSEPAKLAVPSVSNAQTLSTSAGPWVHASLFLFNPYGGVLMQRLANRLAADFPNRPAGLGVLYYKPENGGAFDKNFEMLWCETTGISPED